MNSSSLVGKACIQYIFCSQICQKDGLLFILYSIIFNLICIFLSAYWIDVAKDAPPKSLYISSVTPQIPSVFL